MLAVGSHLMYRASGTSFINKLWQRLETQNKLFECYLSRKELREIASAPHGEMPVYGNSNGR